ncbi:MAG: glycosyltransferase family 2 protein [Planctomycetota bacterium]|jgi:glycosyltransferase involved in cell wall biosynthesis|nr:glycosyltransferase family 2 protein [Planctomycetota bacterium]
MNVPRVSIIMPVRNEEEYLFSVVESLEAQDYPKESLEIIVADGMSGDSTRMLLEESKARNPALVVIDNPERIVSTGLNRAIRCATGDIIIRVDCHASYSESYVSSLIRHLRELKADNVGGLLDTVPPNDSRKARAIAISMSNPFGVGNSHFRIGTARVREVDTVPFGCFRREVFDRIGLFDEDLVRNQDDEFNARMRKHGMKLYVVPDVVVRYYARDTYARLFRMFYQYGYFKPLVNKRLGLPATWRQFVPVAFVLLLLGGVLIPWSPAWGLFVLAGLTCYLVANLCFSWHASRRGLVCMLTMYAHLVQHMAYGVGYLAGIMDFLILRKKSNKSIAISR